MDIERIDRLEEMIVKTHKEGQKTHLEIQKSQMLLQTLIVELKEFKDEIKNDTKELKDEIRAVLKELKEENSQDSKQLKRDLADVARKIGTIVEDMVVPNIQWIGEKYFNLKDCYDFVVRRKRKKINDRTKEKEFDVIAVYDEKIILNETKSIPRMNYVEEFIRFLKSNEFYEYFPEYAGKEIIPIFASLYIPENILKHLSKNKVYAMDLKEDTMDILNPEIGRDE